MQAFYQMPFEPFERYSPYGTPEHVAEFLSPYIEAGCSTFNVISCTGDTESAISAVGELRTLLTRLSRTSSLSQITRQAVPVAVTDVTVRIDLDTR